MKPIESNNNSITLNNTGTNKRQKIDAGQIPQTISDSTLYFNVYREETTSLSSWFCAGQNSPLGELAGIAVAPSQQSLPTSDTNTFELNNYQRKKLDSAVNRHAEFFQKHGGENSLDMALVTKAVSAFICHHDIQKMLEYACYYFRPRKNNQETLSDKLIENAGAIAKAFSKPIRYNEDVIHAVSLKIGNRNLYSETEQGRGYQPLKHIFTFLKNGKINSLESLEKDILSHNDKKHNADEFNKLLIKVILHYGDFASPTNSVKLVSKLEELGCGKELLSELEKLGYSPGITLDLVPENSTNNFQPDSLPPPVFMDVTTSQPSQVQDMSWEQVLERFKTSGELFNAQNQVLYTSDIPKDLLELIIDCKGKFATMSYDEKQGMSNLILYYGEGVFIAYLIFLKNGQINVKRGEISKKFKNYFALALNKLKEKTDVDHKIEFLRAVVAMIEKLDLDKDIFKSIEQTYEKKSTTLGVKDFYDFCVAVNDVVIRKEEAKKLDETRKVDMIYYQKILYLQAIPKDLLELIINNNGRFSDIYYSGTRGILGLIKNYGEGVFIAYLLALKQKERYTIKLVKKCFELALNKLQEKTDGVKIEFLQAVVTMIGELSLHNGHIVSIMDTYNKKNITVDGYDFCKKIDESKQSKYKFSTPQIIIDLTETSVVETQQNESGAEWLLGINEEDLSDLGLNDLEGYLDGSLQS